MHIQKFTVSNIGPLQSLSWELSGPTAGWHVLIGDNGSGKSSILRILALALVGPEFKALRYNNISLVSKTAAIGGVEAWTNTGKSLTFKLDGALPRELLYKTHHEELPAGAFTASFGPVRRFSGDSQRAQKLHAASPHAARHISLFDEDWTLSELTGWLKDLKIDASNGQLDRVKRFINQPDLLPNDVCLDDVTSAGPIFTDANGTQLGLEVLSDGYRSVIGLVLELLRLLFATGSGSAELFMKEANNRITITTQGVVLIDEIDAHLHPTWQQKIGAFFTRHFPEMQFIVTTHSPLVCRAVAEGGSIFRLPRPGDPEDEGEMITGEARDRLIYGDVLDAYGTEAFGRDISQSEAGKSKLERLAELNVRARLGEALSAEESAERHQLRAIFTTDPL